MARWFLKRFFLIEVRGLEIDLGFVREIFKRFLIFWSGLEIFLDLWRGWARSFFAEFLLKKLRPLAKKMSTIGKGWQRLKVWSIKMRWALEKSYLILKKHHYDGQKLAPDLQKLTILILKRGLYLKKESLDHKNPADQSLILLFIKYHHNHPSRLRLSQPTHFFKNLFKPKLT